MKKYLLAFLLFLSCNKTDIVERKESKAPFCSVKYTESPENRGPRPKPKPGLILLDFDGHGFYEGCNATELEKEIVRICVKQIFSLWNMTVTLSESEYSTFTGPKQRLLFTDSPIGVTGSAIMNTMITGDEANPALVWWYATRTITCCYSNDPNVYAAWVAAHEIGHTLGLWHSVRNCEEEYATVLNNYAPLMGDILNAVNTGWLGRNSGFFVKQPTCPTDQDQIKKISETIIKK